MDSRSVRPVARQSPPTVLTSAPSQQAAGIHEKVFSGICSLFRTMVPTLGDAIKRIRAPSWVEVANGSDERGRDSTSHKFNNTSHDQPFTPSSASLAEAAE